MNRQIEQALLSLMPSYGSDLPPSLVGLASSLHAQSRLKASTLKAEEEIARLYACANLACDRLKITLDLPPIQARPPIPPRIYKRLYTHLDHVLPQSSTPARSRPARVRTPNSKALGDAPSEQRPLPSRGTPTKEQSLSLFRTPSKGDAGTPARSTGRRRAAVLGIGLRPWVKPVIRYLCSETDQPKLASTLVAGMDAITMPGGKQTDDRWVVENYTALLAAIFWWTCARARAVAKGPEIAVREPSLQQRREIISLLTQARKTITVTATDNEHSWESWADIKPRDFNNAVATIEQRSWLGDWYTGVDDVMKSADWDKADVPGDDDADQVEPIRVRRADTMFQDKYDYLSEARVADFKAWKAEVLARIAERSAGGSAMEIDTQC